QWRTVLGPFGCMRIVFDGRCAEYSAAGHPERPARIEQTVPYLQTRHPDWEWTTPEPATETAIMRAHSRGHLSRIIRATGDFDADTPAYPGIYEHAARAAGAAVGVAHIAAKGSPAFSLM